MAKVYLEQLTTLMQQLTLTEFEDAILDYKHFFSGAAVYAGGKICITLTPAGFAIKLPEDLRDELKAKHGAQALRYFPEGPIKKDYVVLPANIVEDLVAVRHWVAKSIEYALTLSAPASERIE